MKIICSNCGRQVIYNTDISDKYCVGKRNFVPRRSFAANEVICHECDLDDLVAEQIATGEIPIALQGALYEK